MMKKNPIPFAEKFPKADPLALKLLQRLLAFDPKDRPTAGEVIYPCYFDLGHFITTRQSKFLNYAVKYLLAGYFYD